MVQNDGGPAFPRPGDTWHDPDRPAATDAQEGMTLLDWFAGMALMGMVATKPYEHTPGGKAEAASECWEMADAMLMEKRHRDRLARQYRSSNKVEGSVERNVPPEFPVYHDAQGAEPGVTGFDLVAEF